MKTRKRNLTARKTLMLAKGGPYAGEHLLLTSPGTLTVKVGAWYGHYDSSMQWVSA
jgi:hypothetical protein